VGRVGQDLGLGVARRMSRSQDPIAGEAAVDDRVGLRHIASAREEQMLGCRDHADARERELAQIIRDAGYDCSQVESITSAPAPPPGWESLRPEIATCQNGKRFLVTKSGRSGGNLGPVVRPMPGGA